MYMSVWLVYLPLSSTSSSQFALIAPWVFSTFPNVSSWLIQNFQVILAVNHYQYLWTLVLFVFVKITQSNTFVCLRNCRLCHSFCWSYFCSRWFYPLITTIQHCSCCFIIYESKRWICEHILHHQDTTPEYRGTYKGSIFHEFVISMTHFLISSNLNLISQ